MKGSRPVILEQLAGTSVLHLYVEMELEGGNGALVYREAADLQGQVLGTGDTRYSTLQYTIQNILFTIYVKKKILFMSTIIKTPERNPQI